ncbi:MAG: phasin family protein [Actinomycetota bacterium]
MLDTVRKYVEAGRDALTPKKAEELARAFISEGQARADQAGRIARDLLDWSRKNSERFRGTIRDEVKKQLSRAGVASKDEVDALKRRIRELESRGKAKTATTSRATTQRSAGARSTSARTTPSRAKAKTTRGTAGRTKPRGTRGA